MELQKSPRSDLLLAELLPLWSRETVSLGGEAGTRYEAGAVLSVTDGLYAPVTAANIGKSAAVLIEAGEAGKTAVAVLRGAVLARNALRWPEGATDVQIAAGEAALKALGLVVRNTL